MADRVFVSHGGTLTTPGIASIPYEGIGHPVSILFPTPSQSSKVEIMDELSLLIGRWWQRCFVGGWTHAFFTVVRSDCFVAEVVQRPRYEFLTLNSGCKAMVVCHARCSLLSSGKLVIGWGETDKRKRLEAMFKRERSLASKQQGMPRISGSLLKKLAELVVGTEDITYLNLMEFGVKWGQGKQPKEVEGGVMQVANVAITWGVGALHSMACGLSGLSAPFCAKTTKFVPAMLATEARKMRVVITEEHDPHNDRTEITVQGGHHLDMKHGYYSAAEGRKVVVLDFASMHPTIVIAKDICPTNRSVLPALLSRLLSIKSECERGKTTACMVKRAYVKFQMVATTGWLGRKLINGGTTGRRKCYAKILSVTRDILKEVIDHCRYLATTETFQGIEVVYGVTDSIFLSVPNRRSICIGALLEHINANLILPQYGAPIRLTHERTFDTLLLLQRNRYCGYTDKANFYTVGIKRRTDHEVASALDDLIYRTLLTPSPDLVNNALDKLMRHLDERNQWRPRARDVVEGVANVCDGGPTPPVIARVIHQIDTLPYPTGQVKRSLGCY